MPNSPQHAQSPSETTDKDSKTNLPTEDFFIEYNIPTPWWKKPAWLGFLAVSLAGVGALQLIPTDISNASSETNILKKTSQGEMSTAINTTNKQDRLETESTNNHQISQSNTNSKNQSQSTQQITAQRINNQDIAIIRVDDETEKATPEYLNANEDTSTTDSKTTEVKTASITSKVNVRSENSNPVITAIKSANTEKPSVEVAKQTTDKKVANDTREPSPSVQQKKIASLSGSPKAKQVSSTTTKSSNSPTRTNNSQTTNKQPTDEKPTHSTKSITASSQTQTKKQPQKQTMSQPENAPKQANNPSDKDSDKTANKTNTGQTVQVNTSINKAKKTKTDSSGPQHITKTTDHLPNKPSTEVSLSKAQIQKIANRMAAEKSAEQAIKKDLQ